MTTYLLRSRAVRVLAAVLVVVGCATGPGRIQSPSGTGAMLYGSLDLPAQVRDQIGWLIIYKVGEVYAPPFKTPIKARVFPNGDFYMENVAPGTYFVHDVVAGFEAFYFYPPKISEAKEAALAHAVEVAPTSLAYLGHYRVYDWKPGAQSKLSPQVGSVRFLSAPPGTGPEPLPNFMNHKSALAAGAGTFGMDRTRTPADDQRVLKHVLEEVQGTGWDARIQEKLGAHR